MDQTEKKKMKNTRSKCLQKKIPYALVETNARTRGKKALNPRSRMGLVRGVEGRGVINRDSPAGPKNRRPWEAETGRRGKKKNCARTASILGGGGFRFRHGKTGREAAGDARGKKRMVKMSATKTKKGSQRKSGKENGTLRGFFLGEVFPHVLTD